MTEDNWAQDPPKSNPQYKTCSRHKIIYVHECPYCKPKVSVPTKTKGVE